MCPFLFSRPGPRPVLRYPHPDRPGAPQAHTEEIAPPCLIRSLRGPSRLLQRGPSFTRDVTLQLCP